MALQHKQMATTSTVSYFYVYALFIVYWIRICLLKYFNISEIYVVRRDHTYVVSSDHINF